MPMEFSQKKNCVFIVCDFDLISIYSIIFLVANKQQVLRYSPFGTVESLI